MFQYGMFQFHRFHHDLPKNSLLDMFFNLATSVWWYNSGSKVLGPRESHGNTVKKGYNNDLRSIKNKKRNRPP